MSDPLPTPSLTHRVELIISRMLRVGVCVSLALLIAGTLVSFLRSGRYGSSPEDLHRLITSTGDFPHTISWFTSGLRAFRGQALIVLGLVVLIATPVLRVAVSIVAFAIERDFAFVAITSAVLALLGVSLLIGK